MINKIKKMFQPKQRDFWGHIADARVNKNNPDYELITVTDKLTKLHKVYSEERGLDPLETPIHETINAIDLIKTKEELGIN
jgi:hypothetical protein